MKFSIGTAVLVAAILAPAFACAQIAAGDLKSKGTRMAKDDLEAALKGSTLRYISANGQPYQYALNADGTFQATVFTRQGRPSRFGHNGTWHVTNEGRFCRTDESKGQNDQLCLTIWKLDGKFYYVGQGERVTELELSN